MAFKCVPLNQLWTGDTKLDLRAVYRRRNGDLMTSLPLRRHNAWLAKGYEYVTLSDADSLAKAAKYLEAEGHDVNEFVMGRDGEGNKSPWNLERYIASNGVVQAQADDELKALIAEYGWETVEKIKGVKVPEHLKGETCAVPTSVQEIASALRDNADAVTERAASVLGVEQKRRAGRPRKTDQVPA